MGVRVIGERSTGSAVKRGSGGTEPREHGSTVADDGDLGGEPTADDHNADGADGDQPSGDDGQNSEYAELPTVGESPDADAPFGRFANGKPRKRRPNGSGGGKTPGEGGRGRKRYATEVSHDIAEMFGFIGWGLGKLLKSDDIALTREEANKLAVATSRVTELYELPILDEKTRAWLNLAKVSGEIFIPRVLKVASEKRARRTNRDVARQGMGVVRQNVAS